MTTYVDAGPIRIGVEYRSLDAETTFEVTNPDGTPSLGSQPGFVDNGVSLHVHDAVTGQEHLRFDAFDAEPHYHYIVAGSRNTVIVWDPAAHGPMFRWALECLTSRLDSMLTYAGLPELAAAVGRGISQDALAEIVRIADGAGTQPT
jgi:hypothetical protein